MLDAVSKALAFPIFRSFSCTLLTLSLRTRVFSDSTNTPQSASRFFHFASLHAEPCQACLYSRLAACIALRFVSASAVRLMRRRSPSFAQIELIARSDVSTIPCFVVIYPLLVTWTSMPISFVPLSVPFLSNRPHIFSIVKTWPTLVLIVGRGWDGSSDLSIGQRPVFLNGKVIFMII